MSRLGFTRLPDTENRKSGNLKSCLCCLKSMILVPMLFKIRETSQPFLTCSEEVNWEIPCQHEVESIMLTGTIVYAGNRQWPNRFMIFCSLFQADLCSLASSILIHPWSFLPDCKLTAPVWNRGGVSCLFRQ